MKNKILVLGLGQNNFLSYLYSSIKNIDPEIDITVPFYIDPSIDVKYDSSIYNNKNVNNKIAVFNYLLAFFYCLSVEQFYKTIIFLVFIDLKAKKTLHFIYKFVWGKAWFLQNNNFKYYDTFHFHFLQYSYLREIFFVPKDKWIVCSFWGSDLLRTGDSFNHFFVRTALSKCNVITVQSVELKEIILSKYGRQFEEKIKIILFPLDKDFFNGVDKLKGESERIDKFKRDNNFSFSKKNITIGNHGNPANNHIKVVKQLLKFECKDQINVIINLNYGLNITDRASYKAELIDVLKLSGVTYSLLERYLSVEELVLHRLATDIFIHVPSSDALSASLVEFYYAGAKIITGSWLPYSSFGQLNLNYVNDIKVISETLKSVIKEIDEQNNTSLIHTIFLSDTIGRNWIKVLNNKIIVNDKNTFNQ